ncbi:transcriptional regulator with XRE-family HTH domain [Flavobacterium sp. PL11]|uniref:helix-turn-helix transcriptional regulator n=1 Tax=Flavobacterium sp. PL11 TaxID=3071717 RepID=UPI002DF8A116|nr:transcriptional regulator with XRE-family HTH domain [Flavobacterium sp. PL11]
MERNSDNNNNNNNNNNTIDGHQTSCRVKMGETLREIREKKGYNQEQLASIMKISRSTISKIESGKFNCSLDYLSKFSWFLDFDINISISGKKQSI